MIMIHMRIMIFFVQLSFTVLHFLCHLNFSLVLLIMMNCISITSSDLYVLKQS